MKDTMFYTKLQNRGLIRVSGKDRLSFLQGLISNDIKLLETQNSMYACLLNAQGKFLHDFFLYVSGDDILMDCEGGVRAQDLLRRLSMYKLRAEVVLACEEDVGGYAVMDDRMIRLSDHQNISDHPIIRSSDYLDTRHPAMGWRTYEKPADIPEKPFEDWDRRRIELCIPDGSRDMMVEKSTLLECGIDKLNGVSWDKGCYVGQELTARMHYRGLVKKRLYAVRISESQNFGISEEIRIGDKLIGEMRSRCGDIGLALLKDEAVPLLKDGSVRLLVKI